MDIDLAALRLLEKEKEIPLDILVSAIEQALLASYQKSKGAYTKARAKIDLKSGKAIIWASEVGPEGVVVEYDDTPEGFGRVASSTARQIIMQRLRDVGDNHIVDSFKVKEGAIVSGVVQQSSNRAMIHMDLGSVEGLLPPPEQIPSESYPHGSRFRAYVIDVRRGNKGPTVTLSRSHPMLVKCLFFLEVPELESGLVEIVGLVRESGSRTKLAVTSKVADFNAKGALIGEMGSRVRAVQKELGLEKIDIVDFSEDPKVFIANCLSPAVVNMVTILDRDEKLARVTVSESQLSLAIGKEGQNARLAARLSGWKIDIIAAAD